MLTRYFVSCNKRTETPEESTLGNLLNSPDQRRTFSAQAAESTVNFFVGSEKTDGSSFEKSSDLSSSATLTCVLVRRLIRR